MIDNFLKLEDTKKQRILNAAFEIFARHGYRKASTLDICDKAAISKGALFHYFENKQTLYFYLYDVGIEMILAAMHPSDLKMNPDFFMRMEDIMNAKMKAMNAYPYIYAFFVKAYTEEDETVKRELDHRLMKLADDQSILLDNIDISKFRNAIDLQILSNLIVNFAMHYIQERLLMNANMDIEEIMQGFQVYMKLLKDNFYKEEWL